ncbi:MAG: D-aminoacylase [Steroidobacteraceae bacterium]
MRPTSLLLACLFAASLPVQAATSLLLQNARIIDGTGKAAFNGDVRLESGRISALAAHLEPRPGEERRDVRGLTLAPGFIDMHSHADRGLLQDLDAATQTRQGLTTMLVGQDGQSNFPLKDWLAKLESTPAAINVASMVGHATVRQQVMGKDLFRPATPAEVQKMKGVLATELLAGGFGISTGLEYEEAHFSTTAEVIELSRVAAGSKGFYISHVRDEGNDVFKSFEEILAIGRDAKLPVEITHIKLAAPGVWHQAAARMPAIFARARQEHINLRADVYPYTYWHSTIRVLVTDRDFFNPAKVAKGLADNGGAQNIRLAKYTPDPGVAGKTLAEIAKIWKMSEVDAYMRIVKATLAEVASPDVDMESIIGASMTEDDVRWFIDQTQIAFCSDGELHGAHPRGAGSFPRVLGRYVREQKVLPLEQAVHKMTGLPASYLGLADRGRIAPGMVADLVLFDAATVLDQSTIEHPEAAPVGIPYVMTSGEWVIAEGKPTGHHPGKVLRPAH